MLTAKQEQFARSIIEGRTQADAYRDAYDAAGMQHTTVWNEASKLIRHPEVSARVEALKWEADAARRVLLLDREEAILARMEHEALTAKTDSARIRALELLGRHAGMFAERVEVERVDRTAAQIEADLRDRLERLGILAQDGSSNQ
jgi:hypothetical protein